MYQSATMGFVLWLCMGGGMKKRWGDYVLSYDSCKFAMLILGFGCFCNLFICFCMVIEQRG